MAAERPDKKEKKDKKRSDEAGVAKPKKEKKEKKDKKEKLAAALDEKLQQDVAAQSSKAVKDDEDSDMEDQSAEELPLERTVVPFAVPLADDKGMKKVYKTIKKGMFYADGNRLVVQTLKTWDTDLCCSRQEWYSQARRQGSRQDSPKVTRLRPRKLLFPWRCHHRRRHLPRGRHLAHPRSLRGPQRALHLCHLASRAGRRRQDQASYQRCHDHGEAGWQEEGYFQGCRQGGR